MALTDVVMTVPEEMVPFVNPGTRQSGNVRNAMIMYPYVRRGEISHGRAAEIIGIRKRELIEIYDSLGIPYLSSIQEYEEDLRTVGELQEIL